MGKHAQEAERIPCQSTVQGVARPTALLDACKKVSSKKRETATILLNWIETHWTGWQREATTKTSWFPTINGMALFVPFSFRLVYSCSWKDWTCDILELVSYNVIHRLRERRTYNNGDVAERGWVVVTITFAVFCDPRATYYESRTWFGPGSQRQESRSCGLIN